MITKTKPNRLQSLIDSGNKREAIKILHDMVVKSAIARRFEQAEQFRQQIMEIDAMALNEIISAAEIIESEKAKSIDKEHKETWASLYNNLDDEQANAFYFSLKKARVKQGKLILKQGYESSKLFFLDSGALDVIHHQNGSESHLKTILPGEPADLKVFFTISVATSSILTRTPVTLHYIERSKVEALEEKFPGFSDRLESICSGLVKNKVEDILKNRAIDRRQYKRYNSSGEVAIYMLDDKGRPDSSPLLGLIEDVSKGGVAMSITHTQRNSARVFLSKKMLLNIVPGGNSRKVPKQGVVTSVYNQLFNSYLLNFKFKKQLSSLELKELLV